MTILLKRNFAGVLACGTLLVSQMAAAAMPMAEMAGARPTNSSTQKVVLTGTCTDNREFLITPRSDIPINGYRTTYIKVDKSGQLHYSYSQHADFDAPSDGCVFVKDKSNDIGQCSLHRFKQYAVPNPNCTSAAANTHYLNQFLLTNGRNESTGLFGWGGDDSVWTLKTTPYPGDTNRDGEPEDIHNGVTIGQFRCDKDITKDNAQTRALFTAMFDQTNGLQLDVSDCRQRVNAMKRVKRIENED